MKTIRDPIKRRHFQFITSHHDDQAAMKNEKDSQLHRHSGLKPASICTVTMDSVSKPALNLIGNKE